MISTLRADPGKDGAGQVRFRASQMDPFDGSIASLVAGNTFIRTQYTQSTPGLRLKKLDAALPPVLSGTLSGNGGPGRGLLGEAPFVTNSVGLPAHFETHLYLSQGLLLASVNVRQHILLRCVLSLLCQPDDARHL